MCYLNGYTQGGQSKLFKTKKTGKSVARLKIVLWSSEEARFKYEPSTDSIFHNYFKIFMTHVTFCDARNLV